MRDHVRMEMFVDVSCPWCHGALESTRILLDELAADPAVPALAVHWRFMRLHSMSRVGGLPIADYFVSFPGDGPNEDRVIAAQAGVDEYCASVGVRVDWSRYQFLHDPFTAHRLLAIVRDDGGNDLPGLWSLARVVFSANFIHGIDIADHAALRSAVERGGLTLPPRIWEQLASDQGHHAATLADHARALEVSLDGVPRIVIGETIVPTWLEHDEVRRQLRAAIAEAPDSMATPAG